MVLKDQGKTQNIRNKCGTTKDNWMTTKCQENEQTKIN